MKPKITYVTKFGHLDRIMRNLGDGDPVRILHDGVEYGVYQEFGTSRGVPPHPFITPAIERTRPAFEAGWKQVLEQGNVSPDDFVDKIAHDALGIAQQEAPVDTGNLANSLRVDKPEDFNPHG